MILAGMPVLTYHGFAGTGAVTDEAPSRFERTLEALQDAGLHCVDLADWVRRGRPDEPRGYALAFDDGLASIHAVVPILQRHQATATVFVVSGRAGGDNRWPGQPSWAPHERLLSWAELDELARLGCAVGSHGVTHARLDRCDPARIRDESWRSRDAIEDRLGRACPLFAYPYGRSTAAAREAIARDYEAAFGTRLDFADAGQDRHAMARIDAFYLRSGGCLRALTRGEGRRRLRGPRALRAIRQAVMG